MSVEICNGRLLLEDGAVCREKLVIEDGNIARIGTETSTSSERFNAGGMLVLPGIVDLHGDAFEHQLMPRPGVHFPHEIALHETDRQLVANGITTAYHGLTHSWEPGLRSADSARSFLLSLEKEKPRLACDTRLHLRFETYNVTAEDEVVGWMEAGKIDLLAFNDHAECFWNELSIPKYATVLEGRSGLDRAEYKTMLEEVRSRQDIVPGVIGRLTTKARKLGIPMASHDDETPEMRRNYHTVGCTLCEFPVSLETARVARELGDMVILGAPNALRGRSQSLRRCAAREAIAEGAGHVLASDYYYPAMLQAAFAMARDGVISFGEAWAQVSANPARAVGLNDRGLVAPGKRADLILVDDSALPTVCGVFVAGRLAFARGNLLSEANGSLS